MHARLYSVKLHVITEGRANTTNQCGSAFLVERSHFSNVPSKVPALHEVGQYFLIQIRREDIHSKTNRDITANEVGWNYDVANAKRGKEHLAERADIDDPGIRIQSLQGGDRHHFVAIFAVVIV